MAEEKVDAAILDKHLKIIEEGGIRTDREHLLKDMCGQFPDPREWLREYVVNGYDAGARRVWIEGCEDDETYTISVEDNGRGMDGKGVRDFVTVFRSVKSGDVRRIIGRHGIGKLSVAAVPGQCGFHMLTSTGKECWRMRAGYLLDATPIACHRLDTRQPRGTRFEITFRKNGTSLREEMAKYVEVLTRYVRYLPIEISVECPGPPEMQKARRRVWIREEWYGYADRFARSFSFKLSGRTYEAVFGIATATHEVYQNRVLVSDTYKLLSHDLRSALFVPHLRIRLDSPDFELPFGRHRLMDENVLREVARHLRETVLPRYVADLFYLYQASQFKDYGVAPELIEEIACSLMHYDPSPQRIWCQLPVFAVVNDPGRPRYCLNDLRKAAVAKGVLYLEDEGNPGVDYSVFDAPVLSRRQPAEALSMLAEVFKKELVNLSIGDAVLVAPTGTSPELGPREKALQQNLRFHPDALRRARRRVEKKSAGSPSSKRSAAPTIEEIQRMLGVCEEARQAEEDLAAIGWQVNYLVARDGTTPCKTHRFLMRDDKVVLNLHHEDVRRLVQLCEKAPNLAGHWGLAMCLAEGNKILPHLTPEARADLILADAVAKAGNPASGEPDDDAADAADDAEYHEFLRNLGDEGFGLD